MIHWNPFAIAALFTALASLWVAANFFIYGKKKIHYLWAFFNLSIFGWSFLVSLAATASDPQAAYTLWNASHGIGIFVSIFFFHSISYFCDLKAKNLIRISYIYGLVQNYITFVLHGEPLNTGVNYLFNSMYYLEVKRINFGLIMVLWVFLALYGNYKLYKFYKENPDKNKQKQAKFLLGGAILGYLGGSSTFFPMLGFNNFYPITIVGVGIYCLINSYAIFKHQLLELNVIYKKSLVYSFLITLVTISYLLIVLILEKLAKTTLGYTSANVSILPAFIVGILVIPLRNWLQNITDKTFLKGTAVQIAEENVLLRQELIQTEKLKAVATLASGLAHEIRNPLTTIQTFAEYLPTKKNDPEFLSKFQRILTTETSRVNNLLTELLTFAKPSPPAFRKTFPEHILKDMLLLSKHRCEQNKITNIQSFHANQPIIADPNQLKQALLNIILNAVDAMPAGGTLTISTSLRKNTYIISIKDTGGGIAPKDLKQIFDPFFTKKEQGTGLGLAITHGIVEQHNGKITVASKLEQGTEFIIHLPSENSHD